MIVIYGRSMLEGAPVGNKNAVGPHRGASSIKINMGGKTVSYMKRPVLSKSKKILSYIPITSGGRVVSRLQRSSIPKSVPWTLGSHTYNVRSASKSAVWKT